MTLSFRRVIHADCRLLFIFIVSAWCNSIHILVIFLLWFGANFLLFFFFFPHFPPFSLARLFRFAFFKKFRQHSFVNCRTAEKHVPFYSHFTFTSIGIHGLWIVCHTFQECMQYADVCANSCLSYYTPNRKGIQNVQIAGFLFPLANSNTNIRYLSLWKIDSTSTFHLLRTIKGYSCTADYRLILFTFYLNKKEKSMKKTRINWKSINRTENESRYKRE